MIKIEDDKPFLYQWDLNMRVELLNIKQGTEVHFSDTYITSDNCLVVESYEQNNKVFANIPNILLQRSGIILVYLYIQDEGRAWTEFKTEIVVLPRKKPANYVYTETEVLTYKKLEVKLDKTQGMIGNLENLETVSKDNLVAAVNEVKHTTDSKQDTLIQSGASVGQIVKISAVDDMGKPTAWEAINIPESAQPDWNQNDNTQPDYVKNRPFYSETRNMTVENVTDAPLKGFPAFVTGDTVNVNVDGVEHSLAAYYDESEGVFTIGDIYSDLENGKGQLGWQFYSDGKSYVNFYATEAHTIYYLGVFTYKIDNKFLNFDGLVRTYNYYFKDESLYKTLYNSAGDECTLYTCSDFILPDQDAQLFGFMSEFGFSKVDSVDLYSCFITGFIITTNAVVRIARVVLGTDTSHMETMAADNGYTYTTNPNA